MFESAKGRETNNLLLCFQVRDEYRQDYDSGRGGYGKITAQKLVQNKTAL